MVFLARIRKKKYAGSWEKGAGSWIIFRFVYPWNHNHDIFTYMKGQLPNHFCSQTNNGGYIAHNFPPPIHKFVFTSIVF
jgi:hypothetical protein